MTFKLNILLNHIEYLKQLVPYYILLPFIILKSLYSTSQPACLRKISSIQKKICPVQKIRAFEASIGLLSYNSNYKNQDYKDPLKLHKSLVRLFEALNIRLF